MNIETVKAAVSAIVILLVSLLSACGINVDGDALMNVLCAIVLIVVTAYGCWKNHNFTEAAQKGQHVVDELKGKNKQQ